MPLEFPCRYGCGAVLRYDPDTRKVVDGAGAYHWCPNFPRSKDLRFEISLIGLVESIGEQVNKQLKTRQIAIVVKEADTE